MIVAFDQRYRLPKRGYFSKTVIPRLYSETKACIKAELNGVVYFAATTDMWTSRITEPYMSFTVHYIDQDFSLNARCLQVFHTPLDHTSENLKYLLTECLDEWGLKTPTAITTDNARNIDGAVRLGGWQRMHCFGHRLHLAITNSLKDEAIQAAIKACKRITTHFSHSFKQRKALKAAQQELNLPQHSLVTDCETRWGSKYKLLARTLEQEPAIRKVLSSNRKTSHLLLHDETLTVVQHICEVLEPLSAFTDLLSGDSEVTISAVVPTLDLFKCKILCVSADGDETDLRNSMRLSIYQYLQDCFMSDKPLMDFLNLTTFLDPRFKSTYNTEIVNTVQMMEVESSATNCKDTCNTKVDVQPAGSINWNAIFQSDAISTTVPCKERLANEVKHYNSVPCLADKNVNTLLWWKMNQDNYPLLSTLARKFLCVPATSVASERAFSTAGNIVSCRRTCLKPDMVNMLLFLNRNL